MRPVSTDYEEEINDNRVKEISDNDDELITVIKANHWVNLDKLHKLYPKWCHEVKMGWLVRELWYCF